MCSSFVALTIAQGLVDLTAKRPRPSYQPLDISMVNIVRQFSLLRQLDDDITHRWNELVSHRACSSVPSRVLVSFSSDFMKCSNVRRVTVCEMIQVDLVVDKRLYDDLGDLSSRQGWCTGFVPRRTLWFKSFHCFPALGILRRNSRCCVPVRVLMSGRQAARKG